MRKVILIMDLINVLLLGVMIVGSIVGLVTFVTWLDANKLQRESVAVQRDATSAARVQYRIPSTKFSCVPDGVAITSLDRLRDAVLVYDHMLTHGNIHQHAVKVAYVQHDAANFVAEYGDAERGEFLLEQCMGWLAREYPAGYNALYTEFTKATFHGK